MPDRSYLIPQMRRVPGPGAVFSYISSTKTISRSIGTSALLLAQKQLISSNLNLPTNNLQAQAHTKKSICNPLKADFSSRNSMTLLYQLSARSLSASQQ